MKTNEVKMLEVELNEKTLTEVAGGSKFCEAFNNCKYICRECGNTYATKNMAIHHWFTMSFRGGGLRHTIKEI